MSPAFTRPLLSCLYFLMLCSAQANTLDFGDLPEPKYPTTLAADGARHVVSQSLYLGVQPPDAEADGAASALASGDDLAGSPDDENAIRPPALFPVPGMSLTFPIKATNLTGGTAKIFGFADWNADGDFADANETSSVAVPTGSAGVAFSLPWSVPATATTTQPVAVRLRLSLDSVLGPTGLAQNGEVEDFFIVVRSSWLDYGDLPDASSGSVAGNFSSGAVPDYRTRAADNGPSHVLRDGLNFRNDSASGDLDVDAESDGLPTPAADGDDTNLDDDEVGLTLTEFDSHYSASAFGAPARDVWFEFTMPVTNTTGTTAQVQAFIDWEQDGDFTDPIDMIGLYGMIDPVVGDGSQTSVRIRAAVTLFGSYGTPSAFTKTLAMRLRISTDTSLTDEGPASDGEVHDQLITLNFQEDPGTTPRFDYGDLPAPHSTLSIDDGPRHLSGQTLFLGTQQGDHEFDGQPSTLANGDNTDGTNDENALPASSLLPVPGMPITFPVRATNVTGSAAAILGFVDWNADGDFEDDDEISSLAVPTGSTNVLFRMPWNVPVTASTTAPVAVRLRLTTDTHLGAYGFARDGEVEDCFIVVRPQGTVKDYGDLPDTAAGSAAGTFGTGSPPDYRTRAADGGPSHVIRSGLYIGEALFPPVLGIRAGELDGESDGFPSLNADGDDLAGDDDETRRFSFMPYVSYTLIPDGMSSELEVEIADRTGVNNTTGTDAELTGFIDANSDGDFDDAGETATPISVPGNGSLHTTSGTFRFRISGFAPATSFTRTFAIRHRLTTDASIGPDGPASDGEVEDELATFTFTVPEYSTDDLDFGDLPFPYKTTRANNGARHVITQNLYLGIQPPDGEADGLASIPANGDDENATDDENAIQPATLYPVPGLPFGFPIRATNNTGSPATIFGFVDWNADGDFEDIDETSTVAVPTGSAGTAFRLPWKVPLTATTTAPVAVRLRISTTAGLGPVGAAVDGEVEDFFIEVRPAGTVKDYGDLPDSTAGTAAGTFGTGSPPDYRTRASDNGPSHVLRSGLYIGEALAPGVPGIRAGDLDGEGDGLPSMDADGDDLDGDDDETRHYGYGPLEVTYTLIPDGMSSELEVEITDWNRVSNQTGTDAELTGFIDTNSDGDFDDPGESRTPFPVPGDGSRTLATGSFRFRISGFAPATSFTRTFAIRHRLTTDASIGPDGPASDGEVEDELATFTFDVPAYSSADLDFGDLPSGYKTLRADNGARHVITQQLFLGTVPPEGEPDGLPSALASGDDTSATDDEDGMSPSLIYAHPGLPVKFPIRVHNTTGGTTMLYGFADWNADGDFLDADEASFALVPDSTTGIVHLNWNVPSSATTTAPVAVRLRIATATTLSDVGPTADGEVEDYFIAVTQAEYDFDDLPDSIAGTAGGVVTDLTTVSQADYRTRLADNGPRHVIRADLVLFDDTNPTGTQIDAEADGGTDSTTGPASESPVYTALTRVAVSNVTSTTADLNIELVASISVKNETGSTATLHGFMDANNDGDFTDAGESTSLSVPSAAGHSAALLTFTPEFALTKPITTFTKNVPIRFRLSTQSSLAADGPAPDGEVQSEIVTISFTSGEWWPQISGLVLSELLDKGRNSRMDGSKHFGQGQQTSDEAWTIGQTEFTGPNPLLNTTFLDSLGTGLVQYSHRARFPDGSLHAYLGFLKVRDLSGYRSFMSTNQLTGDADTPHADSDGDGVSNFTEFAFGTHPGQSGQRPAFQPESSSNGAGGSHLVLPYLRRSGGTMNGTTYATPEIIYQPQASLDILSWDTPMEVPVAPPPGLPTPPSGYEWGAIRLNVPAHLPQRGFLRLNIDSP